MIGRLVLAALAVSLCVCDAAAGERLGPFHGPARQAFVTLGQTSTPIGAREFCATWPAECAAVEAPPAPVKLTESLWSELLEVNRSWNRNVVPVTDQDLYQTVELWTYPDGFGDCEDFALAKRKELMARGWPPSALLMALVQQQNGDGHAVLVAVTDEGDLVLDNLVGDIVDWDLTQYKFIKVSTPAGMGQWVRVEDRRPLWVATAD